MTVPDSVLVGASWARLALVQVTLLAVLGLVAWFAARRGGPALRAVVLLATLVGLLVVPALAIVAPTWLPLPEWLCPPDGPLSLAAPTDSSPEPRASSMGSLPMLAVRLTESPPPAQPASASAG